MVDEVYVPATREEGYQRTLQSTLADTLTASLAHARAIVNDLLIGGKWTGWTRRYTAMVRNSRGRQLHLPWLIIREGDKRVD
jgi:hypothetical protein